MKLQRFFVTGPLGGLFTVKIPDADLAHQLKNVFRYQVGAEVILLDNSGVEFRSQITKLSNNAVEFEIVSTRKSATQTTDVYLLVSLVKKDNFELVVEKGTELGVNYFIPVLSDRSEKKNFNRERVEKIIKEASEQSERGTLPTIYDTCDFERLFDVYGGLDMIAFDPRGDSDLGKIIASRPEKIGILIGPEGGWSPKEIELLRTHNVPICMLGSQVLRAETAAITAASLFLIEH